MENTMKKVMILKKIENTAPEKVYDIEVENEHHYILENGIVSHNSGPIFAASMLVAIKKGKLKEDEDGNKVTDVFGIRAMCKVMKTRYSKPFEGTELKIPYSGGLNKFSGLFELFEDNSLLTKEGNRYLYKPIAGEPIKLFKKEWDKNTNGCLDIVMQDIMNTPGGLFKTGKQASVENTEVIAE